MVLLALSHGVLSLMAMREKSTTADEIAHITGGFTFNHWGDYRLHPENGLLPQRWQTLPTILSRASYPDLAGSNWRESNVWMIGHAFFYELGNNHEWILFTARAMNSIFGIATVLLVAAWARYFFGNAGAFTAAFFCALCPTMIAHSAIATSDMAMTFFLLLSVSAYWWHLHDARRGIMILSLIAFALACVAKYTAVLLLPLLLLMAVIRSARPIPVIFSGFTFSTPLERFRAIMVSIIIHGLGAALLIWVFCGFRYSAFNPKLPSGEFTYPWEYVLSFGGLKAQLITFCRQWHLLPEAYLYGFSFVLKLSDARAAFLDGDYSIYGWISFFPKTFLYKTPPSLLLALVTGIACICVWVREKGVSCFLNQLYRATPLYLLFLVYWAVSLNSHLNIGHRHLLPIYPVLYIFCGILGWAAFQAIKRSSVNRWVITSGLISLLGWQTVIAAETYPHYLAYFSPIIGGSANGYKHLADSSLDWGQDLPGLEKWLQLNRLPEEPVYISYFGTGEPDYYGIKAIRMPMIYAFQRERPWYWFEPGIYAVSATMLQHVYMPERGPWTVENEKQYQELRSNDASFRAIHAFPNKPPELFQGLTRAEWNHAWEVYEQLRFARLCHYLRVRRPDATIGYSILVFRLNQDEIEKALNGSASKLSLAIENALNASISNESH